MKKIFSLFAAAIISGTAIAQIPNSGFETWTTTSGYDVPTGWDQLNSMTSSMSTYTCTKGTPGNPGSSYIKLVSKTVTGMGVMPGIACSGVLDQSSMTNIVGKSGFPSTARPVSLTGNWQYMAYGSDQGYIMVLLSKWNSAINMRDTVAFVKQNLSGMVMSWGAFTIPLTYQSGVVPDSAMIVLSASGSTPVNNSYLYVDNLAFTGNVPATAVNNVTNTPNALSISPNPATTTANIEYASVVGGNIRIVINDINGRAISVFNKAASAGNNKIPLDLSGMAKGLYLVNITEGQNTSVQKLIVE